MNKIEDCTQGLLNRFPLATFVVFAGMQGL
jgi:hypothetical protein